MSSRSARLSLAMLVVFVAACGVESDGPTQSSDSAGTSVSLSSTESTVCCTLQDGRYQLANLIIDGTAVEGWSIGQNRVAELVVAGTSWYFQAQNRFDTTVIAEAGSMVVVPGPMTAAAYDDEWLYRMEELNSYTVEGDTLVLAGPNVTSTWTSAGAVSNTEPAAATSASTTPEYALSEVDRQLIFAAAAASRAAGFLAAENHTELRIDVIDTIGRADQTHITRFPEDAQFSESQRQAIVGALAPLSVLFVPPTVIDDPYYVTFDGIAGNVVLSIAEPVEDDGEYRVTTALWCGLTCGHGGAEQLQQFGDGTWSISGPIGPEWVS